MSNAKVTLSPSRVNPEESTVAFYNANAEDYVQATLSNDLSALYPKLLDNQPARGLVLDAGCGSGRDILEFQKRGFRVEAFDASPRLAEIAKQLTGVEVSVRRFEDWIAPVSRYDGIWCFASLLHVARSDLPSVLQKLYNACKPGGWLFASFKEGEADTLDDRSRHYTNFTVTSARNLFNVATKFERVSIWAESGPSGLGDATTWVYALAQRTAQ